MSWVQKAQDFGFIVRILSGVVKGSLLNEKGRKKQICLVFPTPFELEDITYAPSFGVL